MPPDADADWTRRVMERAKELDRQHRARPCAWWQTPAGLTLSLRFLRTAARRLLTAPQRFEPRSVPHPEAGQIAVTFVGHATVMLTTPLARLITDPCMGDHFMGLRRAGEITRWREAGQVRVRCAPRPRMYPPGCPG